MGFFDSIIKDIANGDLDKKLEKLADNIEKLSGKMENTVEKIAEKPEQLSKRANDFGTHAGKAIDGIIKP
jgi:peptidoglycan hydrolase CwlO-like protein